MVKVRIFGLILLTQLPLTSYAALKSPIECYVFINSSVTEQRELFFKFNEEFYLSRTLQRNAKVNFIDISNQTLPNHYTIPLINDNQGIWVRKFKPQTLPTLFLINKDQSLQRVVSTTAEIRQCLQGK